MKKILYILVSVLLIGGLGFGVYNYIKNNSSDSLTLTEKQWIENNKNKLVDFAVVSEIPMYTKDGNGIVFDFLTSLQKNTNLEFNISSYIYGDKADSEYSFSIKDKLSKNDILVYEDNYAVLTKKKDSYNSISDIKDLTIGVVKEDRVNVEKYLTGASNVNYVEYDDAKALLDEINKDNTNLGAIVLPKNIYLANIVKNDNLTIAYNITELSKKYVITLGKDNVLNSILRKYYKKWEKESYEASYNDNFSNTYFNLAGVSDKEQATFKGTRYSYGFIDNIPFDTIINGKFVGINTSFLRSFSKISGVEITFTKYDSIDKVLNAFNNGDITFFFGNNASTKYKNHVYKTVSTIDEKIVIISKNSNNIVINNLTSLTGKKVRALKSSAISETLKENKVDVEEVDNVKNLLHTKNNEMIALDLETYNYYKNMLSNFKVDYEFSLDSNYKFVLNNSNNNKTFNKFFNFYLSYANKKQTINDAHFEIDNLLKKPSLLKSVVYLLSVAVVLFFSVFGVYNFTNRDKKAKPLSKNEKLKYIDNMTSLKNRNYLNDNIDKWDDSEVYPQSIVIVNLNNISYINDNYGHEEGDNVIKQAANILITNQVENSEILRTNGDEFLVYLVGYNEKQTISYIKKIQKEFKNLEHGFGACTGSSMILNPIKTIDDAINEAMSEIKEEKLNLQSKIESDSNDKNLK